MAEQEEILEKQLLECEVFEDAVDDSFEDSSDHAGDEEMKEEAPKE